MRFSRSHELASVAVICGLKNLVPTADGLRLGLEAIRIVEAIGADIRRLKPGDVVIMPFAYFNGTCSHCQEHLYTSCVQSGFFGSGGADDAQA